jgi:cytochrome c peroxidase
MPRHQVQASIKLSLTKRTISQWHRGGNGRDWAAFKTPTLRNVADTAPYMHDGSLKTLRDVVEHYDRGGIPNQNLDPKMQKLDLEEWQKQDLVAFLAGLRMPDSIKRLKR